MSTIISSFVLYSREDCHLCEDMIEQLQPFRELYDFEFSIVDVDSSADLIKKYGLMIPLLCYSNKNKHQDSDSGIDELIVVCKYFLDEELLIPYLKLRS
ncbi:MAG: glutaredoxin family protein [Pseudomonadota bacterium]